MFMIVYLFSYKHYIIEIYNSKELDQLAIIKHQKHALHFKIQLKRSCKIMWTQQTNLQIHI